MGFGVLDRQLLLFLEPGAQTDIIPQSLNAPHASVFASLQSGPFFVRNPRQRVGERKRGIKGYASLE